MKNEKIGVVVIGRNEGSRLILCLDSILKVNVPCVYIDSQSIDSSIHEAEKRNIKNLVLDKSAPVNASRARNTGFKLLIENYSTIEYVHFIDADCELHSDWLKHAVAALEEVDNRAVVCGRLHEKDKDKNIYTRLCDIDWYVPPGDINACGGISTIKRQVFEEMQGFDESLIAGADPELYFRISKSGYDWAKTNTIAFGSTRNLNVPGTPIFMNAVFPPLDDQYASTEPMLIGPHCRDPYAAPSIFNVSGMSYGALSKPAVQALSRGAAKAGIWMNTGEGGLSPHHLDGGCDVVYQIGTAKFGVRDAAGNLSDEKLREVAAKPQVKMFEIKLSQGAKPGKGGILPAAKVNKEIAEIRGIPEGQPGISPNRHREVDDFGDLLDLIAHIREVTGKPVGFKTCMGSADPWVELFDLIRERGAEHAPDFITVDGGEGGTGAAPMPLMDLVGLPLREALVRMTDLRDKYGLHERIRIVASGKLINPGDVAWAICAGADFVTSARGFMFSLGCIQALKCNKNTCPTGITTHDDGLQKGLVVQEKHKRVAAYAQSIIYEVETIAHSVGVAEPRLMRRRHVRIVRDDGSSVRMNKLYPSQPIKGVNA